MNVFDNLEEYSSNLAVNTENGIRLSYNDFLIDADCIGKKLNKRSLIFIITGNNSKCVTGYVGALRANAVVVLINDSIHEELLKDLVKNFKPAFIYQPENIFQCQKYWEQKFKFGEYVLYDTKFDAVFANDIKKESKSHGIYKF